MKQMAIGVSIALAVAVAAYGVGRIQTSTKIDQADQRAKTAESASASAIASVRMQVEIEKAQIARLEARRRLHLAVMALDDRNFGTAQQHLATAKTWLASAKGADPKLVELSNDIDAQKLVATEDVGEQRTKVLALIKRLDELVPPATP